MTRVTCLVERESCRTPCRMEYESLSDRTEVILVGIIGSRADTEREVILDRTIKSHTGTEREVILDGTIKSRAGPEQKQSWVGHLKVMLVQNGSNLGWDN